MSALHFYPLRVAAISPETDAAVVVEFELPEELRERFRYRQGQHLTIRCELSGEEQRRSYSICASVAEEALKVAVKRLPGGRVSGYINDQLRVGDVLDVMPPDGRFFSELDPNAAARHYLAIAAGSGITPIYSIIKTTLEQEPQAHFTLIYGNRSARDIIFLEALQSLKDRYAERLQLLHVLSRESQDVALLDGRIDAAKLQALAPVLPPLASLQGCFLCGPLAMVETMTATLSELGVAPQCIHSELFSADDDAPSAAELTQSIDIDQDATACELTLILDGRRSTLALAPGELILDAALKSRPELPFACKGGVCSTCRALVISGEVSMQRCYGLTAKEVSAGYVLTCQARARGASVVLDFDQR